ncbi:MAG: thiamine pyrophosphate-dependent dehydrogenase E1 component subunit alpha [Proteobacteria bacterium]|nr:thiamine pyrophosphate-dependent dehydrogenase E1 component subunit alpha [Pseudomonadota bacterium]
MNLTNEKMIEMYTTMVTIRKFEEKIYELTAAGSISGFVHLYLGEEAIATGVCTTLRDADYISSTHRGHGHLIAKGGKTKLMMAELFAKSTGYCRGKGGSMHIADLDLGILGANGIVGGGPPLATGAALTAQYTDTDNVVVCFFGDGASNQGTTHEAMNMASIWKLPVVFVAENNGVAEFTPQPDHQCIKSITERAAGYDIPGVSVDGNDVTAVYEAASEAITYARQGKGPTLLECRTYRIAGHFVGDPEPYRSADDVTAWKAEDKDPIPRFEKILLEKKVCSQEDFETIKQSVDKEMDEAVTFAQDSPEPDASELLTDVYTV